MSGGKSRTKGHNFERAVARWFREHGIPAKRGWQSRGGGKEEADVMIDLPYHIEAKALARSAVYKYMEQAVMDSGKGGINGDVPVVILKADRKPWLAIMLAEDWIENVKEAD